MKCDIAMLLAHTAGYDPYDSTSSNQPVIDYVSRAQTPLDSPVIGIPPSQEIEQWEPYIQKSSQTPCRN